MPAKCELVRYTQSRGLSERRALQLACLSPSVLRYERKDDGYGPLRERIAALAHHHLRLTQEGRSLKCLTVVDDATQEAVMIAPDTAISGMAVPRMLEQLKAGRGLPKVIRSDNGRGVCSRAMAIWAHKNGVQLSFIEPGKPSQNAYVESFNGRLRDEWAGITTSGGRRSSWAGCRRWFTPHAWQPS